MVKEAGVMLEECIREAVKEKRYDNLEVRTEARDRITRYLMKKIGKRPMVLPVNLEINI